MAFLPSGEPFLPSGDQSRLVFEDQEVVVVEVGGGLRWYRAGDREILDGYGPGEMCSSGRGQPLIPWPNRLAGASYRFAGSTYHAAIDEPATGGAIHGLTRWQSWTAARTTDDRAELTHRLRPSPAYPFDLALRIEYSLGRTGLTVRTQARNDGPEPCPYAVGFHPYLAAFGGVVDDLELRSPAATRYLADDRGIPTGREAVAGTEWDFRSGQPVGARRLDTCFTDLERDAAGRASVTLVDAFSGGSVTLWMDEAFTHLMLFSGDTVSDPDRRRRGLAVEPMTAAPDAFNSGDGLTVVAPGQTVEATWGITPT